MFAFPHDVNGWLTEAEGTALAALAAGLRVVEAGSYCGRSTVCLAQAAAFVIAVDPHTAGLDGTDTAAELAAALARHGVADRVAVARGRIEDVAPRLGPGSFAGAFHDAEHTGPAVRSGLAALQRLVAPGGWLAVHDYHNPEFPAVAPACRDVLGSDPNLVVGTLAVFRV